MTWFVDIDLRKIIERFGTFNADMVRAAKNGVEATLLVFIGHTIETKLSGQELNRVTGTGQRSVSSSLRIHVDARKITGAFGSHLDYMRAHEQGFSGPVTVPAYQVRQRTVGAHSVAAHTVRAHVRERGASSVRVAAHRRKAYRRREHIVRAHTINTHTRFLNIRARRYLRKTMQERFRGLPLRIARALGILARTGRIPLPAELVRT